MRDARIPWITAGLVLAALVAAWLPGSAEALAYDRAAVDGGRLWLMVTGQMVHWTPRMLVADLSLLAAVGGWLELRSRRRMVLAVTGGALLVGLAVHLLSVDMDRYRGSSGIGSALFVAAAIELAGSPRWRGARETGCALLCLFLAKVLLETWTGEPLAAGAFPDGVRVAPWAHLFGGLAGMSAVAVDLLRGRLTGRWSLSASASTSSIRRQCFPPSRRMPTGTG